MSPFKFHYSTKRFFPRVFITLNCYLQITKTRYKLKSRSKCIRPHNGTDVPSQVSATGGGGQVLLRVQPVRVDHEVTIGQVSVQEHMNMAGNVCMNVTVIPHKTIFPTFCELCRTECRAHISGVFDLFFPLKNSGRALLSISWMLKRKGY